MLQPSIVCSYLLPHYSEIIPDGTINYAWLECADSEIKNIENIKLGPMAVHSLLRLLQLMTAAHQHILQKPGRLCRDCFEEATKNIFIKRISALAPREQKKEGKYIYRLEKKPPHWGLRLWERTMKNILERPFVDIIAGGDILCCHNGPDHCLSSISINAEGTKFLWINNNGKTIELPSMTPPPECPKAKQTSTNETVQGISPNEIPQQAEETTIKNDKRSSLPIPTELELQIYRLNIGLGKTQQEIAAIITAKTGNPCSQSTASRAIRKVRQFLEAGNVLPDLTPVKGKSVVMDPAKIDMGERQEGKVREDYSPDVDD